MRFNFLKKKVKEVNGLEDIDFSGLENEDIQWLLETLHQMPLKYPNDTTLGENVRRFFREIDQQHKDQIDE